MTDLADFLASTIAGQGDGVELVPGTVTAISPLTVTIAGSTTAAANIKRLTSYTPTVGDAVVLLRQGPSFLVMGTAGTAYKGLVYSAVADVTIQGASSTSGSVDKTIFDVVAPVDGWAEVTIGTVYYGFSGGSVTTARGALYSNRAGTAQPPGGAWQSYTALGAAVGAGTWTYVSGSPVVLVLPMTAGVSTGVVFRGLWTASPAANCWFAGMASCKLYAS